MKLKSDHSILLSVSAPSSSNGSNENENNFSLRIVFLKKYLYFSGNYLPEVSLSILSAISLSNIAGVYGGSVSKDLL